MNQWISAHLFYHANADPLLTDCVAPLVERLRQQGVLSQYFFIRYWENGPHIRLRLKPASVEVMPMVRTQLETAVSVFFSKRPSMFPLDAKAVQPFHREMFIREYGEEAFVAKYGDGPIPIFPSNSIKYIEYEPEIRRYGGLAGMALSERHFDASSDFVLTIVRLANLHLRRNLLGTAFQAMLVLSYGLLGTDEKVRDFIDNYFKFWLSRTDEVKRERRLRRYERQYGNQGAHVRKRIARVRGLLTGERVPAPMERKWLAHLGEVRASIIELFSTGQLDFGRPLENVDDALKAFLLSYVHMTANRIGASIDEETYLAYVTNRALGDELGGIITTPDKVVEVRTSEVA